MSIRAGAAGERCEWCEKPPTGFAEWQGDGLAHPSCGEECHGFGYVAAGEQWHA